MKFDKIITIWDKISKIGIDSSTTDANADRVKLLNRLVFCIIILLSIITIQDILRQEWVKLISTSAIFIFLFIILFFNFFKKYKASVTTFIVFNAIAAFGLLLLYGQDFKPTFAYITLIFCITILVEKQLIRYIYFILIVFLFFVGEWYVLHNQPLIVGDFTFLDKNAIFISCAICTFLLANIYVGQIKINTQKLNDSIAEIRKQNVELNNANMDLEQFTFVISHDLKTPIRSIVSFLDLIERKTLKLNDSELDEYVQFAKNGGKKMNEVINGVLEYSKLNFKKEIDYERVSLEEVVISNFESLKMLAIKKNANVITEELPELVSNKFLLKNLFQNIIENGLLYNDSKEPEVNISVIQNKVSYFIAFKDNGRGIEMAYQKQIFDIFQRIDFESDEFQGVGIGLSICKKIVQRLNGTISLTSQTGHGTTVTVELPIIKLKSV
jgi:signal transduction histidine kinase